MFEVEPDKQMYFFRQTEHSGFLRIAERCVIAPLDLLQFILVAQCKQSLLNETHFLHFAHHILVDAIHNFLFFLKGNTDVRDLFLRLIMSRWKKKRGQD